MKFCTIAPGSMLEDVEVSNVHLLLPQVNNYHYIEFYKKRRKLGDTLILDNGAYEGKFSEARLISAIKLYDPQFVVLPDALLQDHHITYQMALDFSLNNSKLLEGRRLIYIPQAEKSDIIGATNSIYAALVHSLEHHWDIGLPRAFATHMGCPSLRVEATKWLRKEKFNGHIHAFGMANGSLSELSALRDAGIDTCDSSCAVWRGMQGFDMSLNADNIRWDHVGTPVDFDSPRLGEGDSHWEIVRTNQELIQEVVDGK